MRIHSLAAVLATAALAAACGGRKDGPVQTTTAGRVSTAPSERELDQRDQAMIRVVQLIPEAPKADVYAGDTREFTGINFGTVTPYKAVPEEHFTISLKPAGQTTGKSMIEAQEGVESGRRYTVLSLPDRDGAAKIDVISDDAAPPAAGKAKLRVIHAAPEAGSVDVYATGSNVKKDAIISNVDYGTNGSYREIDPASVSVRVQPRGHEKSKQRAALEVQKAQLEAGKLYTLIVAAGDKAGKPVDVIKIEDKVAREDANGTTKEKAMKAEDNPDDPNYEIRPDVDNVRNPDRPAARPTKK